MYIRLRTCGSPWGAIGLRARWLCPLLVRAPSLFRVAQMVTVGVGRGLPVGRICEGVLYTLVCLRFDDVTRGQRNTAGPPIECPTSSGDGSDGEHSHVVRALSVAASALEVSASAEHQGQTDGRACSPPSSPFCAARFAAFSRCDRRSRRTAMTCSRVCIERLWAAREN